jgi:hypothetical protein
MDVLVCAPEELRRSRGNPGSLVASIGTEGGGELSVLDVHAARDAAARAERVRAWATHDDGIRRWARPVLR